MAYSMVKFTITFPTFFIDKRTKRKRPRVVSANIHNAWLQRYTLYLG
jgi:hypothetical protein